MPNAFYLNAVEICSIGLFGKLQRVMQRQKKTEVDFMKKLEIGPSSNGNCLNPINVFPSFK